MKKKLYDINRNVSKFLRERKANLETSMEGEELKEVFTYLCACEKSKKYLDKYLGGRTDVESQSIICDKYGLRALGNMEDEGILVVDPRLKV